MESNASPFRAPRQNSGLLTTSAYFGIGAGALGSSFGSGYATVKGHPVLLWTMSSGAQCFLLGSTFWLSRGLSRAFLQSERRRETLSFTEELACSTFGGSIAGITAGALRGRANVIPAAIVWGVVGLSGQAGISSLAAVVDGSEDNRPLLDRMAGSKWSLFTSISDVDYKQQLEEQIDGIDVEISMVNDQISALKKQRQANAARN